MRPFGSCLYFSTGLVPTNESCFKHFGPLRLLLRRLREQNLTFVDIDISVFQTFVSAKGQTGKADSDGSTGSSQSASGKRTRQKKGGLIARLSSGLLPVSEAPPTEVKP